MARAMWKGVLVLDSVRVPVKLYAALNDRSVHFRLLHDKDRVPVKQALVNPEDDAIVPYGDALRAYVTDDDQAVLLRKDELDALKPEGGRDIEVLRFVPEGVIDHRWYKRPYYLGPDGAKEQYAALIEVLGSQSGEGVATWQMRNNAYVGALRLQDGHPMLISLRHSEEVIALESIPAPAGGELDDREIRMAEQLVDMLADEFDPTAYQDEYRDRVLELIATKEKGGKVARYRPKKPPPTEALAAALEASLKKQRASA